MEEVVAKWEVVEEHYRYIILVGPFALRANFGEMVAGLGNADITCTIRS